MRCEDCKHSEMISTSGTLVARLICNELKRISCVFARADGGECGPNAEHFMEKTNESRLAAGRAG